MTYYHCLSFHPFSWSALLIWQWYCWDKFVAGHNEHLEGVNPPLESLQPCLSLLSPLFAWHQTYGEIGPRAELIKARLRQPKVSAEFKFRYEFLKKILFAYNFKIECSKRNREKQQMIKKPRLKLNPGLVLIDWALVYTNYRLYRKGSFLHSSLSWLGRVHMRTYASHSDWWKMYCSNCKQARSLPVCNWLDIRRWNSSSPHRLCVEHTCGLLDRPRLYKGHLVLLRPWQK